VPSSLYPIEAASGAQFYAEVWERVHAVPRARFGEISRFAVSKQFRRRHTEADFIEGISPHVPYFDAGQPVMNHRRVMPYVTLGLFAAVIRLSVRYGVTHWFAVMEPTLLRLLRAFGIHFPAIGPVVEYHGRRQPTLAVGTEVAERARQERPDVWDLVTDRGRNLPPPA
jgi:N-acyl amino acid synthase of PEP-CTERM/exosortase system